MRHENHPGGSGTRLLLNVAVWASIPLQRHATLDTALQFSCVDADGTPASYMVKFANSQQAARMLDAVSRVKTLLASGSDKAVLTGMMQWKAKDANTKTPSGRG